jgi:uncharacterized protein
LKRFLENKPPHLHFTVFIFSWMVAFFLAQFVLAAIIVAYHGIDNYEQLANNLLSGNINIQLLKSLQLISSLFIFMLPPIFYAYLNNEKVWQQNGLQATPKINLMALVMPIMFFSFPFIAAILTFNQNIDLPSSFSAFEEYIKQSESDNENLMKKFLVMNNYFDLAFNILVIAIVPAIAEEFFFRGCLQRILTNMYRNVHIAIIMSAIIFSFIHFQFYGFLPRMILGIMFGYLFAWTNNLWYSIFAHFINNGLQVVLVYLYQEKITSLNIEEAQEPALFFTLASTALMFYTLSIFREKSGSPI